MKTTLKNWTQMLKGRMTVNKWSFSARPGTCWCDMLMWHIDVTCWCDMLWHFDVTWWCHMLVWHIDVSAEPGRQSYKTKTSKETQTGETKQISSVELKESKATKPCVAEVVKTWGELKWWKMFVPMFYRELWGWSDAHCMAYPQTLKGLILSIDSPCYYWYIIWHAQYRTYKPVWKMSFSKSQMYDGPMH